MAKIFNGRYTAKTDQPFVVFLIGMRINQWWRFDKWIPVVSAMTPMLTTLFTHPEKGFLHAEFFWNFSGPVLIQYWRSFEELDSLHGSPPSRIWGRGRNSTKQSVQTASSASGMRPTWSTRTNSNASMATCRYSDSARRWSMSKQPERVKRRRLRLSANKAA